MHCGKCSCESSNICWWYVCSAPGLVDPNVFWVFVVTMLLNTKSSLIVTKWLVFFFAPQSINSLFHQMFFWTMCVYNFFLPSEIPWCVAKSLTERWWWHSETSEIALLCSKQAPRHYRSVLFCSKKHSVSCLYCMYAGCSGVGKRGNGAPTPFCTSNIEYVWSKRLRQNMAAISQMC